MLGSAYDSGMDTILIVEDDDDLRDSILELLQLRGFNVVAAADGQQALDELRAGLTPCLIILDLMLPVVSGWEFRNQQLSDPRLSEIPTVIVSGINNLEIESRRLQATAFVSKPINFDLLFKTVEQNC